jgi:hypothetical protein
MSDKSFKKFVTIVFSILLASIVVLGFLVNVQTTHISRFIVEGGNKTADIKDQKLQFKFNTPVSKVDSKIKIKVQRNNEIENIETKEFVIGESVYVFFKNNLSYDSDYKIELSGLRDIFQKEISNVNVEFKTISAGFYYMEMSEKVDKIMKYELNSKQSESIFESENIQNYVFNSQYMTVVIESDDYSKLLILNLKNGRQIKELKFDFQQIGKIDMTQKGNRILFTLQDYEFQDDFVIPTTGFVPYYYDVDNQVMNKFEYGNIEFDISEVIISPDSNFVLFEDNTEGFYLIDLNDADAGIGLGRFISTGGFSYDTEKIVFLSFEPENMEKDIFVTYYDIKTGLKTLTDGKYEVIDPKFFNNSDNVIYSKEKDVFESRGIYEIVKSDLSGNEEAVFDEKDVSLEYPRLSYDDRYVVIEKYALEDLLEYNFNRSSGYLTKPERAELVVYDLIEKKLVSEEISGIEAKWF